MKLFKIYNKLTDNADKEYRFLAQSKSNHLDKAREIISFLEDQDIDLYRMPDYDNSDEPNTGSGYYLFNKEATVFDRMGVENTITRSNSEDKYENNYDRPDVYVIAMALQKVFGQYDTAPGDNNAQSKSQ
jgi:hypothetical protein